MPDRKPPVGGDHASIQEWNEYATILFRFYNTPRCPFDNCRRLVRPENLQVHLRKCEFKIKERKAEPVVDSGRILCVYCRGYIIAHRHSAHTNVCRVIFD